MGAHSGPAGPVRRRVAPWVVAAAAAVALGPGEGGLVAQEPAPPRPLAAGERVISPHFATAIACALCHSNAPGARGMRDGQGRGVAPYDLWQATMMANSARDPLWRAAVSAEVAATPSRRREIEAKCLRCHAPMASVEAELAGEPPLSLDLLRQEGERAQLALDGVSCTACHQIEPAGLGEPESYSGHFQVNRERRIYGPHAAPFAMPMRRNTGFTPVEAGHLREAGLCATCHTLFSEAYRADGSSTGEHLPEQTPFLEWRNSTFAGAATCQDCHAPVTDEDGAPLRARIARSPMGGDFRIGDRAPFGRHVFVGGNTLVPAILRDNPGPLRPLATPEAFEATIALTRAQLEQRTARVTIDGPARRAGLLTVPVRVHTLTGHKLPTGHPSRRAWLRVRVRDAGGRLLFASGEHDDRGRLVGPDGRLLSAEERGGPLHPHRERIASADAPQVYEAVLEDADGAVTWRLLRGARYAKDSRLLPQGWRPDGPDAEHTAPRGIGSDPDFQGGGDAVLYEVPVGEAAGPLEVEVSLLYQVAGARYLAELLAYDTPEVRELRAYLDRADLTPVTVATATVSVGTGQ